MLTEKNQYSGALVYDLNLFYDSGEDGCVSVGAGRMGVLVVFVTRCRV